MIKVHFYEKQTIPQLRKIILFSAITLSMLFIALMVYLTEWDTMPAEEKPFLLFLLAGPLTGLLFFMLGTEIRITSEHFEYRTMPFSRGFKSIPHSEISSFSLKKIRGIQRFRTSGNKIQIKTRDVLWWQIHVHGSSQKR